MSRPFPSCCRSRSLGSLISNITVTPTIPTSTPITARKLIRGGKLSRPDQAAAAGPAKQLRTRDQAPWRQSGRQSRGTGGRAADTVLLGHRRSRLDRSRAGGSDDLVAAASLRHELHFAVPELGAASSRRGKGPLSKHAVLHQSA